MLSNTSCTLSITTLYTPVQPYKLQYNLACKSFKRSIKYNQLTCIAMEIIHTQPYKKEKYRVLVYIASGSDPLSKFSSEITTGSHG